MREQNKQFDRWILQDENVSCPRSSQYIGRWSKFICHEMFGAWVLVTTAYSLMQVLLFSTRGKQKHVHEWQNKKQFDRWPSQDENVSYPRSSLLYEKKCVCLLYGIVKCFSFKILISLFSSIIFFFLLVSPHTFKCIKPRLCLFFFFHCSFKLF